MKEGIVSSSAQHKILIVSPMSGAEALAATLGHILGCFFHVAATHRAAWIALRHREYSVVVMDDCMAETNPAAADLLWQSLGMAVPVNTNFAFAGGPRLARIVRAAIVRREQQQVHALRAAASLLESELKSTVTGLLLQSQLALAEPSLTPRLSSKLTLVAELAGTLRRRLEGNTGRGVASSTA